MRLLTIILIFTVVNELAAQNDTLFWQNGVIKSIDECYDDSCITRSFYESGQLKELNISISGSYWLYSEKYCENGQLIKKHNPNCETPELVKEYLCDGTLSMEYYRNRKGYRGLFKVYHKNGQVAEQGSHEKSSSPIGDQKVGLWESFTPDGRKFYECFYENGIKVNEKNFK